MPALTEKEAYERFRRTVDIFDALIADPHPGLVTWHGAVSKTAEDIAYYCETWKDTWKK